MRIMNRLIAASALAAVAFSARAQAPAFPALKNFKDWEVGCDNLRGCIAIGVAADGAPGGYLRISRAAGPDAKPEMKVVIDDNEVADFAILAPAPEGGATGLAAFVAAARKAERATIGDAKGARKAEFSLAGAAAALLFIDDVQGRVGGATALMRPGPKPASDVPPAPKLKPVKPVKTASFGEAPKGFGAAMVKALPAKAKEDCDRLDDGEGAGETYAMGRGRTLVFLPCSAGAYNFSSVLYLVTGRNYRAAQAISLPEPSGKSTEGVTNGEYDPASGQLSYFAKGRGIGDCGVSATYGWTGSGFALMEYRSHGACRGVPPEDWPVLWRNE